MAVSDSTDFNLDAAEVIQDAYERCGIQEISGKDLRSAVRSMNLLMAEWANRGLNLWTVTLGTQSTAASDNDYALSTNVVDLLEVVLPKKSSEGKSSQLYLERTTTPTLYLFPTPDVATYTIRYYYLKRLDDIDVPTDDPNVPFRFLPCLTAGMAYYLAMKKAPQAMPHLKQVYEEECKRAMDEDRDRASFSAVPGRAYFNNY